jgi:adrenergic receptor alpha-1A
LVLAVVFLQSRHHLDELRAPFVHQLFIVSFVDAHFKRELNMNSTAQPPSRNFLISLVTVDFFLVIFGVVGNIVVIVYNVFLNVNKNPTSYFVLNLAVSDLLVCGIYFPTYMTESIRIILGIAEGSNLVCKVSFTVTSVSLALSVVNIMVLTIDRYISITLPLRYPSIVTTKRVYIALVLIWSAGLVNGGLVFMSTESSGVPLVCEVEMTVAIVGSIFCFYIPLTATVFFNLKIMRIARSQRRKIAIQQVMPSETSNSTTGSSRRHLARQFKLFKTFTMVFGCFIICVTPFPVVAMIDVVVCGGGCIPIEVVASAAILAGANSVVNAFIYGVRHEEYRRAFRTLLSRPCRAC